MHSSKTPHLPAPLRGQDKSSPAEEAITIRFPKIVRQIIKDNPLSSKMIEQLNRLIEEIPHGQIHPLPDTPELDVESWNIALTPYLGQSWLEPPWFVVETYFYRRIVAALDYFINKSDPFSLQKEEVLKKTLNEIRLLCKKVTKLNSIGYTSSCFKELLQLALWGNQVDLSLWTAEDRPHHDEEATGSFLLVDHSQSVADYIETFQRGVQIDILIDNAAFELMGDLCLVDYLLTTRKASKIRLHLKLHPTFVSDATCDDVEKTITFLQKDTNTTAQTMGLRLAEHLKQNRLQLHAHPFWTSLYYLWDMPQDVRDDLAGVDLVISKGDANYRRALGDLHWPHETPVREILANFPSPLLFLRTCKSNLIAGLDQGQATKVEQQDSEWLTNGKWGLIQLVS